MNHRRFILLCALLVQAIASPAKSDETIVTLKKRLQSDDFKTAFAAALELAKKNDMSGMDVLEAAAKKKIEQPNGLKLPAPRLTRNLGMASMAMGVDDFRVAAIMAIERLEPKKAFPLYIQYLENAKHVELESYYQRFAGVAIPYGPDVASQRLYALAKKNNQQAELISRFKLRFKGSPKDINISHILSGLLKLDGQNEEAVQIRLKEVEGTSQSPEELAIRRIDLVGGDYQDLLKFDASQVAALAKRHRERPFWGVWRFDSHEAFREIVKFRIAERLPVEQALEVYKEIFAANSKAEYGGSMVAIFNRVFRRIYGASTAEQRRACHARTAAIYAEAVKKSPNDHELKVLYTGALVQAEDATKANQTLLELIRSRDLGARIDATFLIKGYYRMENGKHAADAVAMLSTLLDDESPHVRKRAAHRLGQLRPVYQPAISNAIKALGSRTQDSDTSVATEVIQALKNLGR